MDNLRARAAPPDSLASSHLLEFRAARTVDTGGIVKAEGLGAGGIVSAIATLRLTLPPNLSKSSG
jgi:hypothetical protein